MAQFAHLLTNEEIVAHQAALASYSEHVAREGYEPFVGPAVDETPEMRAAAAAEYAAQIERERRAPRNGIRPAHEVVEPLEMFAVVEHTKRHITEHADAALDPRTTRTPRLAISATCGTGKTTTAGEVWTARLPKGRTVEWAQRSDKMAAQLAAQLTKQGAEAVHVVLGRRPENCQNYDRVKMAIDVGLTDISRVICSTCPFRQGCAYFEQRDAGGLPGHTIYSHSSLQQPRPRSWASDPVAVIVDEAPALGMIETFDLSVLGRGRTAEEKKVLAAIKAGNNIHMTSIDTLTSGLPAGATERDRRRKAHDIVDCATKYHGVRRKALLRALTATGRDTSDRGDSKFRRLAARMRHHNAWLTVLRALKMNLNSGQRLMRVRLEDIKVKTMLPSPLTRLWTSPRDELVVPKPLPALYLDGTADPLLAELMMTRGLPANEVDFRFVRLDAKINAKVIQIENAMCSASTFKGSAGLQDDAVQIAGLLARRGEKVLVIGATKELLAMLEIRLGAVDAGDGEIAYVHAGDCPGRNDWQDFTVVILAGLIRTPISVAEDEAIAVVGEIDMLLNDDGTRVTIADMNKDHWQHRGYRMKDGSWRGVSVPVYSSDPIVDAMWRQSSDARAVQSIHRLRMVHFLDRDGNRLPENLVINMTKEPLDITVDRLVPRREIVTRALDLAPNSLVGAYEQANRMIALTAAELAASGAYPSASAARDCPVAAEIRKAAREHDGGVADLTQVDLHVNAGAGKGVAPNRLIESISRAGVTPSAPGLSVFVVAGYLKESKGGQRPVILIEAPEGSSNADLLTRWHDAAGAALRDLAVIARLDHIAPAAILQMQKREAKAVIDQATAAKAAELQARRDADDDAMHAAKVRADALRPLIEAEQQRAKEWREAYEARLKEDNVAAAEGRQTRIREQIAGRLRHAVYSRLGSLEKADLWLRCPNPIFGGVAPIKFAMADYNMLSGRGDNLRAVEGAITLIRRGWS